MPESGLNDDLTMALHLADIADRITMERFGAQDLYVRSKPDRTPVTEADTAVEEALRKAVAEKLPHDGVLGEEYGGDLSGKRAWVIDPIDGTKNFLRGTPVWATLIALLEDGVPTTGVVSAPGLSRRWWAATGQGAWTTDHSRRRRIRVSEVPRVSDAYLSTTSLSMWTEFHSREAYLRLADACWENRGFGDFWQHCLVAEGAIDIAAEPIVAPWDIAAVRVLVQEAGGTFTDLGGSDGGLGRSALATNGRLHQEAVALLTA